MDDLAFADATSLAKKIQSKAISSSELLSHYVRRMDKYNPEINAIVVTQLEKATQRAKEADAALAKGENWGPLHGVPMTVKESYDIAGLPTTYGDPANRENIADTDAVACQRLQEAGAVIFGKTNVPIHLADLQSYNEIYGVTGNPFNLSRTPGGSSGGSAAALAAGLTGLEMGSDIGGSIRNPAHFCGVFGHKPTWGILPTRGHALKGTLTPGDISVIGPLARSAEDLKLVMDLVAGADDLHSPGWTLALPEPKQVSLKDYKIAVWLDDALAPVDDTVKERVLQVARLVEAAGGQVDYDARPDFNVEVSHDLYTQLLHAAMSSRQSAEVFDSNLKRLHKLEENDQSQLAKITRASTLYYKDWNAYNESRTQLRWAWHEFFKGYDLLLTPMCATSAFAHDHNPKLSQRLIAVNNNPVSYYDQVFWAGLTGVSYLPSTVVPTGLDHQGLPIGVQIVSREMGDLYCIEFARKVSQQIGGFVAPPAYAGAS
ncbi:MAG: amidase [bacterium]|nr:amidase [Gammaproteobacteria bacterium]HIL94521.1 amidase [Pseudomonadales bacterium]